MGLQKLVWALFVAMGGVMGLETLRLMCALDGRLLGLLNAAYLTNIYTEVGE